MVEVVVAVVEEVVVKIVDEVEVTVEMEVVVKVVDEVEVTVEVDVVVIEVVTVVVTVAVITCSGRGLGYADSETAYFKSSFVLSR